MDRNAKKHRPRIYIYRGINEINPRTEEKTTLVALVHEFFFLRLLRNVYYTYTCIYMTKEQKMKLVNVKGKFEKTSVLSRLSRDGESKWTRR